MTYDRILVASDLSDEALDAAALARAVAHPRTRFRVTYVRPEPWPPVRDRPRVTETREMLDIVRAWARRAGIEDAEVSVPVGSAPRALVRDAEESGADLLVLGHKGRTRAPRRLLGSTARAILRAGTVDTLIARDRMPLEREPLLQSIVVATDFHGPSEVAAERALHLAKSLESDLSVVHVVDPSLWYDPGVEPPEEAVNGWLQEEIRERLTRFNREHLQGRATEVVLHGRVAPEIVRHARHVDAKLLVIGDHGAGVLERAMIGSAAETIVELAHCSVLVVRAGGS